MLASDIVQSCPTTCDGLKANAAELLRTSRMPQTPKPGGYVFGRPTLYRPEYCQRAIEFMGQGYSVTALAGELQIAKETIYGWIREHADFMHAINTGRAARVAALEAKLLTTSQGVGVTAAIFALKNADPDEWQDRYQTETKVNVSIEKVPDVSGGRLVLLIALLRMARRTIPVVEVTDPDGIKSFWAAYAIPHNRAVAEVQDRLPPGHTAELAGRRLPDSRKLKGARQGDVIKLEYDANSALRIESLTSARSVRLATSHKSRRRHLGLEETVAQLLATARNLPPGQKRQDALIEIGRLRNQTYLLLRSAPNRNFRNKRGDSGGS